MARPGYELGDSVYVDQGCSVSPSCLRCPLPQCRYDDPMWAYRQNEERNREIVAAISCGMSVEEARGKWDLSRRTVYRILEAARKAKGEETSEVIHVIHVALPRKDHPEPMMLPSGQLAFGWDTVGIGHAVPSLGRGDHCPVRRYGEGHLACGRDLPAGQQRGESELRDHGRRQSGTRAETVVRRRASLAGVDGEERMSGRTRGATVASRKKSFALPVRGTKVMPVPGA